jgi:hypothetical protein
MNFAGIDHLDTGHQQYRTFNPEKPQHYREQTQQTTAPTAR